MAANAIVKQFLKGDCDSLLIIDDDMSFEPDALERLRSLTPGAEYGILQAITIRSGDKKPSIMRMNADKGVYDVAPPDPAADIEEVDGCGLAFTLIRRSVFESLSDPWFYWPKTDKVCGEDVAFCFDATKNGVKIGVANAVPIGHAITNVFNWDRSAKE
jgi:GT2 family glycosyltransferase